jgi:ABC-2 type transport system ATP-binding protein
MSAQPIIVTHNVSVRYGQRRGISQVNLEVLPGEVFGFLGPNGAGKTTTQRVLLDLIRPTTGTVLLFGQDWRAHGPALRQRIGYLPGELSLPGQLTAQAWFTMVAGVRGLTDLRYQQELCERLQLDPHRRLREYSRGNKQKVGLVAALMHQPELLILDEPTGGLDPLVQHTVLELVRETRAAGRTVFFSSHILSEVQAVCDRVGIIREGTLVAVERVDQLTRQQFRRLRITLERPPLPDAFAIPGVHEVARAGTSVTLEVRENLHELMQIVLGYGLRDLSEQPVTLDEIFMAYYGNKQGAIHA